MAEPQMSMVSALEQMALSLAASGTIPASDLIRCLERIAERLRGGEVAIGDPADLVTQSDAARAVGVSRQAVHQWVAKRLLHSYQGVTINGRPASMVSMSEAIVMASRSLEAPLSTSLRRQYQSFMDLLGGAIPMSVAEILVQGLDPQPSGSRRTDKTRVLREFVTSAMGTRAADREFTETGARILAALPPVVAVDITTPFGRLALDTGVLVRSASGQYGFDSVGTSILGVLALATLGAGLEHPDARVGLRIAGAAEATWGNSWIDRLLDVAYYVDENAPSQLTRYTASLSHLTTNRFYRQAQTSGVSVSYSRSPGILLPQCFYGEPRLRDILAGQSRAEHWGLSPEVGRHALTSLSDPELNPFRIFTFEKGVLDGSIHGVRRYVYSAQDAARRMRSFRQHLTRSEDARYIRVATANLARAMALPFVELVSVDHMENFDWWKDHTVRASSRELLIGLRGDKARKIAHAIGVQTALLPEVVETADSDSGMRERLRIYVKNLEFGVVSERYQDDIRRGTARVVRSTAEHVDLAETERRAEAEIRALAHV